MFTSDTLNFDFSLNIVVTGGSGFLGAEIIRMLIQAGCENITSIARSPQLELERLGVKVLRVDIRDERGVCDAIKGADIVFHTAAKAAIWGRYQDFHDINFRGTENIINACEKNKVSILIYTSSPSVVSSGSNLENVDESVPYPKRFFSYYALTKALSEQKVIEASSILKTVSLRPHLIWGPRDPHLLPRIIKKAQAGKLIQVGSGENMVDLTYIENAAFAHLRAAHSLMASDAISGKSYFITDDAPVNLWEWINNFLRKMNIPEIDKAISYKKAFLLGILCESVYRFFKIQTEPPITRFSAIQLSHSHYFDISAAKKEFDYYPLVKPDKALNDTINSEFLIRS